MLITWVKIWNVFYLSNVAAFDCDMVPIEKDTVVLDRVKLHFDFKFKVINVDVQDMIVLIAQIVCRVELQSHAELDRH